ncbi:MAG: trigger factor, partial [Holdemanella sp.]|nr:trigger factor [Holdemanella sp.]
IKGFRKGQVPDAMVRRMYPKQAIYDMAVDEVANAALRQGIEETKIELVDRPTLDVKEADDDKIVLVFNCVVMPEVTLGEYKGLDVTKDAVEVTEEDIEKEVKSVQERYADWVIRDEDETAQDGDQLVLDYAGTIEGVAFDGGTAQQQTLVLGSNTFIPGFEDQLVGVKAGEEKDVVVTFPEDYNEASLAGKEATFKCLVHDIKYKELPEVSDELIQKLKLEGVETVEQFKEKKKDDLTKRKENEAEEKFGADLIAKAVENASVEIPQVMIDTEVKSLRDNYRNQLTQYGISEAQYMQAMNITEEDMNAQFAPQAESRVREGLVLDAIAKAENIEISDEEVEAEYNQMAEMYGMEVAQIKNIVSPFNIKDSLSAQKAVQFLKDSAKA